MSLTLELPAEAQAQLQNVAAEEGHSVEETASLLLLTALARDARAREREVESIRKGLADSLAGRVISLDDWNAKIRAQYNIQSDAEPMTHEEALTLP